MTEVDWILREARIDQGPLVDIALHEGRIRHIQPQLELSAKQEWSLAGLVVLPGFIDSHVHLDKSYVPLDNYSGTLYEAIELWLEEKPHLSYENYLGRMHRSLKSAIIFGTTTMRTHIDIDASGSFSALEAALKIREEYRDMLDLQIVALGNPGASDSATRLMRTALDMGADIVGGAPALTDDPEACIRAAFDLAEAFDKDIDLHIDETEDPQSRSLELLAEQTSARGFEGRVTAGHCCSLAFMETDDAERIMDKVAAARVNIITLPSCNLVLMGRGMQPAPRGITRVKELLGRGVVVAAASDNVQDPFNPFGRYDALMIANLAAHTAQLTGFRELGSTLEMIGRNAASLMGLKDYGLRLAAKADLVVVNSKKPIEVITGLPERLGTFKSGQLIIRQEHQKHWLKEI